MDPLVIVAGALLVALLLAVSLKIVPVGHVFVTERLGKHQAILGPGMHFVIPVIDSIRAKLDMGEQVLSKSSELLVTMDNFVVALDADVFHQITDPRAAVYEVADHVKAVDDLTVTTLRTVLGGMTCDEAIMSRQVIGTEVRRVMGWTTDSWGIRVNRIEVTAIDQSGNDPLRGGVLP